MKALFFHLLSAGQCHSLLGSQMGRGCGGCNFLSLYTARNTCTYMTFTCYSAQIAGSYVMLVEAGWLDGWMSGWIIGWMDKHTDETYETEISLHSPSSLSLEHKGLYIAEPAEGGSVQRQTTALTIKAVAVNCCSFPHCPGQVDSIMQYCSHLSLATFALIPWNGYRIREWAMTCVQPGGGRLDLEFHWQGGGGILCFMKLHSLLHTISSAYMSKFHGVGHGTCNVVTIASK